MPGKREDVISWDEFFMRAAVAASLRISSRRFFIARLWWMPKR